MALRWFLGLNLDQDAWDASTFSQNRRRGRDTYSWQEPLRGDGRGVGLLPVAHEVINLGLGDQLPNLGGRWPCRGTGRGKPDPGRSPRVAVGARPDPAGAGARAGSSWRGTGAFCATE